MRNNHHFPHAATVFFLLTVAVALLSWVGSIYGVGEVQNLLGPEGIRWELRHVVENFVEAPALGMVSVLFFGFGIVLRSGIGDAMGRAVRQRKPLSHKERRALTLAVCVLLVYVSAVGCITFSPWSILHSVTGSLVDSPFRRGIFYLVSLGAGVFGGVFGYASGRFRDDKDIVEGMSFLFVRFADYFVVLFFIVQFFSALMYTHWVEWLGINTRVVFYAFHLCCFLPLLWMIGCRMKKI